MNAHIMLKFERIVGEMRSLIAIYGEPTVRRAIGGHAASSADDTCAAAGRMLQELGIRVEGVADDTEKEQA